MNNVLIDSLETVQWNDGLDELQSFTSDFRTKILLFR